MMSMNSKLAETRARLGLPETVDLTAYNNITQIFAEAVQKYPNLPAVTSLGQTLTYAELDELASRFATYLEQHTDLQPGDRMAVQLPNLIQYHVVLFAALRLGIVVVNTNPLYTERELYHQIKDSGAKAIMVLANVIDPLKKLLAKGEVQLEKVIVTELADLHSWPKRVVINAGAKYLKKMVPGYSDVPNMVTFREALAAVDQINFTPTTAKDDDLAMLQYTGGTTGVAKAAMLTHSNLIANVVQALTIFDTYGLKEGQENCIMPLPLYHIYSFTVNMFLMNRGTHIILIPDPRNIPALVKAIKRYKMTAFNGINPLFISLCQNPDFKAMDFSGLKMTLSGGMALTSYAADLWQEVTGQPIYQGYGLTETSPIVSVNPGGGNRIGTIGVPVPSTEVKLADQNEEGGPGELCIRGPQVMKGYWNRPDATEKVIDADGWFHSGDIAEILEDGYIKIVDRKKDMIIVSGFNVYPNEIEDELSKHPDVLECAAIGLPDDRSGELIKMFVVSSNPNLTAEQLRTFCKEKMTAYKVPKLIEFREDLPKTNVGKVLRRELRDEELAKQQS